MPELPTLTVADLVARDLPGNAPEGFRLLPARTGFHMMVGDVYGRMEDGLPVLAFRCSPRHMNNHGACHGGMIAAFADFGAYTVRYAADLMETSIPTAELTVDFLRPIKLGDWVELRTQLTKRGRNLLFARMTATVDDRIVFTAKGIFVSGPHDLIGKEVLDALAAS